MKIVTSNENDPRFYNAPIARDVATVFRAEDWQPIGERTLVDNPTDGHFRTINIFNPMLDPRAYPLTFPFGEQGWHIDLLHDSNRDIAKETE